METTVSVPNDSYKGNKGFSEASPARLTALALKYLALASDPATPAALRDYSRATADEIRAELSHRAPLMEAA